MTEKNGGPAFPFAATDHSNVNMQSPGMSLRDWFAGQIAASLTGGIAAARIDTEADDAPKVAKAAYTLADAMLAARKGGAE